MISDVIQGVMRANNFREMPEGYWERQVTSMRTLSAYKVRVQESPEGPDEAFLVVLREDGSEVARKGGTSIDIFSDAVGIAHQIAQ